MNTPRWLDENESINVRLHHVFVKVLGFLYLLVISRYNFNLYVDLETIAMFEKLSSVIILKTWDSRFTHGIALVDEMGHGYRDKVTYQTCSSSIKVANLENGTSIKDENRANNQNRNNFHVVEKENVLGGDGQNVTSNTSLVEGSVINNKATTSIVAESSAEMHETTNV
ncbi:hypothetical protein Tco_1320401 [Tanacetum coccineum]